MKTQKLGYKFFNILIIPLIVSGSVLAFARMAQASPGDALASVDLSGTWTFTPQGQSATTITVPGGGWYKQGFTTVNEADYQRSITVPNAGVPQVTKIEFGAVNYQADLYINNTLVGTNVTAFLPSEFDISNYVTPGNTYTLKVHVKGKAAMMSGGHSTVPNAANWQAAQTQGIFRSAFLKVYPQIYISDEFVRSSVTNNTLTYDVWVRNNSGTAQSMVISSSLSSWNGDAWAYPSIGDASFTAAANATTKVTIGPIAWNLGTASYWWPNVPYVSGYNAKLHNLNLSLKQNSVVKQTKTARFGFREFKQAFNGTRTYYYLNGVRVNLRGDSLQTQNYDGINYGGGKGDAMGTYPGFLSGASGWPKAVDNYQKLNYNVVRMHQIPATPYMLDVCDEKGLMIIQESAIRGPSDQNFSYTANFVGHITQMVTRDKDHPSIVKWSISNEADAPNSIVVATAAIQTAWYNAAKAVDPTRPINIDTTADMYNTMTFSDLSVLRHYGNGFGVFTDNVFTRTDRPFGEGEFIWPNDKSKQGFTWFATSMQAMRRQDASDIRPYTLLSAWAGLIPGVKTTDFVLEQGGNSIYGENNLPNPWSNSQFIRVQAGFNPVLVADRDYWAANKNSNANGDWPVSIPTLAGNTQVTRTLEIFNDTFSGSTVDVYWEARLGSPTGTLATSGELHPSITPGFMSTQTISFTVPNTSGNLYLVLIAKKSGVELFRENNEVFTINGTGPTPTPVPGGTTSVNDNTTGTGTNQFEYVGAWTYENPANGGGYQNDLHYSNTTNNYYQVRFNGVQVAIYGKKAPTHGIAAVSIDGGAETNADFYATTAQGNVLVWTSPALTNGAHTLKVRVTGTKNASSSGYYVIADRVDITSNWPTPTPTTVPPTAVPPTSVPNGTVSINAGGSATGSFTADQYFSGGSTYTNTATIDMSQITTNPPPAAVFNTERYGAMTYTIPNRSGAQTVTLYFAETYVTAAGQRIFNVSINGSTVLSNFDIYASSGGANRAIARTFNTTANASGQVVIQFTAVTENPKINAITVAAGVNPTSIPPTSVPPTTVPPTGVPPTGVPPTSVSINAGGSATGSFTADQYFSGGSTYTNTATIDISQITSNPPPVVVFNTERYGAMTYTIPNLTAGRSYTVTLYFAETYLTAAGQRLFNVSINGATALSSFDIYASAGGANRAIARSFTTTANSSGQVVIQFISGTQNPKINAITVAG